MKLRRFLCCYVIAGALAIVCLSTGSAFGQNISSSVQGLVVDPSGAPVPAVQCALTNQKTTASLAVTSATDGTFTFPNVLAGTYRLVLQANGFKTFEMRNVVVTSSEVRVLGDLRLELGEIVERVQVADQGAPVQLASAEKAGLITGQQIDQIAIKGRDFFGLLLTVPGVVDVFSQSRETTSGTGIQGIYINGGRNSQKNYTVDGVTAMDTGSNGSTHYHPNMDAIAEVRVLTSNYQAEFGRNSGGTITVITKSGTQAFHGSAYNYYRHESLNANSFFNNRTGTPKSPYRYRISGYSIGGPVYIPKVFNTDRSKLFFFWSQEFTGMKKDFGSRFANMPTEAERNGDYSRSLDVNGRLLTVRDPVTGAPFSGNIVPLNRISKAGQSILNFFPAPNYQDPDPLNRYRWNYRAYYSGNYPRREEIVRVDWNARPDLQVYYRYIQDKDEQVTPWGVYVNGSVNYMLNPVEYAQPGKGHAFHATKTFSPTLVAEFLFAKSRNQLSCRYLDPSVVDRSRMGNLPEWYKDPPENPTNFYPGTTPIPNVSFGGQPVNPVNASLSNRPPNLWFNDVYNIVGNISKVWQSHTFKAGLYLETSRQMGWSDSNYKGAFSFAVDANNPLNTGHSYANALLGYITSYSETTSRVFADPRFRNVEWYMQDNWRVTRRLTLDFGVRFYHQPPMYDANSGIAGFDPSRYDPASAPSLYRPALDASRRRVAQDPISGAFAPTPMIGLFVPGSGNFANGMRVGGKDGYPDGLFSLGWLAIGPRIGLAYDLFGNGKTALRAGFGGFKDRLQGNPTYWAIGNPPVAYTPTLYYGNLDTYAQGGGTVGPSNVRSLYGNQKHSTTMNFSAGIQHRVRDITIDASYVGSLSRHLPVGLDINPIPLYGRFDTRNADPTQPALPLPDNFLRPYRGFGSLALYTFSGTSNYNALQTSINRRFTRGLQFGVSYTWSKVLGVASGDGDTVSPYFPARQRNYGPLTYDRSQYFVANYVYDLPKLGARLGWKPAGWVLDNWQISGITVFVSGAPFTPGYSTTNNLDITGSSEGARIDVVGAPRLSKGEKTFFRNFDTSVFRRPARGEFGNAGLSILRGPGVNNFDISVTKRFPIKSDDRFLQFRTELFNAWNHTQFSGLYSTARFDPAGNQIDPNFGAFSADRTPRVIQLSLKLYF